MLSFAARVTSEFIEKPIIGLCKTIFPKTRTVVKKMLNPNLGKGEQIIKRTIFGNNNITCYANVKYMDLTKENGKKILKAYNYNNDLVAEGTNAIKKLMQNGEKVANWKFYGTVNPKI